MADDALIYSYRTPEDRELIARHWCQQRYNGDTRPETLARVKEELESLDHIGLAWAWREAQPRSVQKLADDFDPWTR